MKARPHSIGSETAGLNAQRGRGRLLVRLCSIALVVLVMLGGAELYSLIRIAAPPTLASALAASPHSNDGFYWRHSMWLADARTYAHMVAYLLRPESTTVGTNLVVNS